MYRFYDLFGQSLEKAQLGRMDFPFYHALACILIHRLCHGDITYLTNI